MNQIAAVGSFIALFLVGFAVMFGIPALLWIVAVSLP